MPTRRMPRRGDLPANDLQDDPDVARTIAHGGASRGAITQPTPNAEGKFTVQPMQQAVVDANYGDAETPMPTLDLEKLTGNNLNGQRLLRGPISVDAVRTVLKEHDYPAKHLRALELYTTSRQDVRDLKLAEHEIVRKRDEAIAIRCEKMVGSDDESREPKKDGSLYKHTKTSVEAWAYEHDEDVVRFQRERDQISVSLFHAETALDICERALKATGYLIERNNAGTLANTQSMLAKAVEDLPNRLIQSADFIASSLGDALTRALRAGA